MESIIGNFANNQQSIINSPIITGKSPAPAPPPAPAVPQATASPSLKHIVPSPKKITDTLPPVWSPSRGGTEQTAKTADDNAADKIPVNAKGLNETELNMTMEEPTKKPVSDRLATWKKNDTPQKSGQAVEQTLEARLASWEQKVTPGNDDHGFENQSNDVNSW